MFSVSVGQFHLFFLGVLDELVVKFHFKKTRSVGVKPSHGIPIKKKTFSRRLKNSSNTCPTLTQRDTIDL
jgi:hypothetical protein